MPSFALTDATCWVAGYDFTTDLNQISVSVDAEQLDTTTFGSGGYRQRIGGLKTVQAQVAGFWQSAATAAPDPQAFPDLGVPDRPATFAPTSGEGSVAYSAMVGKFTYDLFGQVGAATPFSLAMAGTNRDGLVRGLVAAAKGNVSATGALGSVQQVGAVPSGQFLYAALHVFSAGTTMTVQVQSATTLGFGSPTVRGTFAAATAVGGLWLARVPGPITDTYWRLNVSAITGTFQVAGVIAIGS
ncbi:hypothetical protein [Micromonospora sp. WMMD998]|uniref:hypothetical protein n=1 Tax=Micromonospora sp. WMMD998 TaxID=3016092 RepID=UPI00249A3F32|nr:hypothetical protein [Micromonospora sp. WMMD998]WFE41954.1 hypothetical protein O7619_27300 [Micromonospora sp. WMMD998]